MVHSSNPSIQETEGGGALSLSSAWCLLSVFQASQDYKMRPYRGDDNGDDNDKEGLEAPCSLSPVDLTVGRRGGQIILHWRYSKVKVWESGMWLSERMCAQYVQKP